MTSPADPPADGRPIEDHPFEPEAGASVEALAAEVLRAFAERQARADAPQLAFDPERVEQDLARLVLALIEFVRQLLEAQAIRRMERGRLSEEEEERLGLTLMRARERLVEIAEQFGLGEEDLTLDLGALGRLC
ncbi:MAG: gas vesicle protein K [Pseudomonadota bacterium]